MGNKKDQLRILNEAMNLINLRKYKDALELVIPIEKELELSSKPDKKVLKGVSYILAKSYNSLGKYGLAENYFSYCLKAEPKNLDLLFSAGLNALAVGSSDNAKHFLRLIGKHYGYHNPLFNQLEKTINSWQKE